MNLESRTSTEKSRLKSLIRIIEEIEVNKNVIHRLLLKENMGVSE